MKRESEICTSIISSALLGAALMACAARPAPEIKGRWKAVNHYPEATEALPLRRSYVFYPSPLDRTLKAMLSRWTKDSKRTLTYLHSSDFTLHAPVAQIRTSDLQEAARLLTAAYAEQRVSITATEGQILVRATGTAAFGESTEEATNAAN